MAIFVFKPSNLDTPLIIFPDAKHLSFPPIISAWKAHKNPEEKDPFFLSPCLVFSIPFNPPIIIENSQYMWYIIPLLFLLFGTNSNLLKVKRRETASTG
jgi:hypothetical protein